MPIGHLYLNVQNFLYILKYKEKHSIASFKTETFSLAKKHCIPIANL